MVKKNNPLAKNATEDLIEELTEKPFNPDKGHYPDPGIWNFYRNFEERIIYIDYEMEGNNLSEVSKFILYFNKQDRGIPIEKRKPIRLYIFSYGGELEPTLALMTVCEMSKTPIYTYNMGVAFSAGFFLLLAGTKRFAIPGATALFHQGSSAQEGTYEQVQANAEYYKKQLDRVKDFVIKKTKITKQLYTKKQKSEWFMDTDAQIQYGVVDEIIGDIDLL